MTWLDLEREVLEEFVAVAEGYRRVDRSEFHRLDYDPRKRRAKYLRNLGVELPRSRAYSLAYYDAHKSDPEFAEKHRERARRVYQEKKHDAAWLAARNAKCREYMRARHKRRYADPAFVAERNAKRRAEYAAKKKRSST